MKQRATKQNYRRAVAWTSASVVKWTRMRIEANAGRVDDVPEIQPPRLMRLPEVRQFTGLSTSTLYRMMAAGEFPRPISIEGPSYSKSAVRSLTATSAPRA